MKKEDFLAAELEESLVVGRDDNIFAFEELKRSTHRNRKFSTNKMKQEIELENLKFEREELILKESELLKEGLHQTKIAREGLQESKMVEGQEESQIVKEGPMERELLKERLLVKEELEESKTVKEASQIMKEGLKVTEAKVDEHQAIQSSLDKVRKEKSEIEGELTNIKSINLKREELKVAKGELEGLRSEVVKAKKGEVSRKVKLGAVVVEALFDSKGKLRKYKLEAEVEKMNFNLKGDVVEVVFKGSEEAVEKTDRLLRELTSTCFLMTLKDSEQNVLSAGESLISV